MKHLLCLGLLWLLLAPTYAQSKKIKRVTYQGERYLLYPLKAPFFLYINGKSSTSKKMAHQSQIHFSTRKGVDRIRKLYNLPEHSNIDGQWMILTDIKKKVPHQTYTIENNQFNGWNTYYSISGKAIQATYYQNDTILEQKAWNDKGQLRAHSFYYLDTLFQEGSSRTIRQQVSYYPSGGVETLEIYDTAGILLHHHFYYPNGQLKCSIPYWCVRPTKSTPCPSTTTGQVLYYHPNGQLHYQLDYNNYKIANKECCEYYPNGQKKQCGQLIKGVKVGEWKSWHPSGTLKSVGTYAYDSIYNCQFSRNLPTFINATNHYLYSYQVGNWKYYSEQGQLQAAITYQPIIKNQQEPCSDGTTRTLSYRVGKIEQPYKAFDKAGQPLSLEQLSQQINIPNEKQFFHSFATEHLKIKYKPVYF